MDIIGILGVFCCILSPNIWKSDDFCVCVDNDILQTPIYQPVSILKLYYLYCIFV